MLSRIVLPAARSVRAIGQRAILRSAPAAATTTVRAGSQVAHAQELTPRQEEEINKTTYDFQSTPEGPWAEGMGRQQKMYNQFLIGGIAFFFITLALGKVFREDMYWVDPPLPKTNPPIFTMKQMAEDALAALEEEGDDDDDDDDD